MRIIFNNKKYDLEKGMTLAELLKIMRSQNILNDNEAILVIINNTLISLAKLHETVLYEGDIITTRIMPLGG